MITKEEYLVLSHTDDTAYRRYYLQFSNKNLEKLLINTFGYYRLKTAYQEDQYFNTIYLKEWDNLLPAFSAMVSKRKLKSIGEDLNLLTCVSTLKIIAEDLVNRKDPKLVEPSTKWTENIFLGQRTKDKINIYLDAPSWECGYYWDFGYLVPEVANQDEHYTLSEYGKERNLSLHDALKRDYNLTQAIADNLWSFCELIQSAYKLKITAEVLRLGGAYRN